MRLQCGLLAYPQAATRCVTTPRQMNRGRLGVSIYGVASGRRGDLGTSGSVCSWPSRGACGTARRRPL
jgi:hypothetical protein